MTTVLSEFMSVLRDKSFKKGVFSSVRRLVGSKGFGDSAASSRERAMSGNEPWFEGPDEPYEDEWDESDDLDEDDEATSTLPCPECGADVYEDAVQCPACGNYITHPTSVWAGRPGWWILLGLLGAVAAIVVLAGLAF
jgi:hypothetical protein